MPFVPLHKRGLSFLIHHRHARASASTAVIASTMAPSSGIMAVNNSQGASAAALELGRILDCALREGQIFGDVDEEEDNGGSENLSAQLMGELARLDREAGRYANARLSEDIKSRSWSCSRIDAQLIGLAMSCAAAVYQPSTKHEFGDLELQKLLYVRPSHDGTVKATAFTVVQELEVLFVAIRGTANVIDHMVNANGEVASAADFINGGGLSSTEKEAEQINCHAGFLNGARALRNLVTSEIRKSQILKVVFCGHSAGGAVAALLFAHFLSNATTNHPNHQFSLITFGSPPVTRPNLTPRLKSNHPNSPHRGLLLAFVNEFDIVTRADRSYVRSLVDLYISSHHHQPQPSASTAKEPIAGTAVSPAPRAPPTATPLQGQNVSPTTRTIPPPDFYNLGDLILLKGEIIIVAATSSNETLLQRSPSTNNNDNRNNLAPESESDSEESRLSLSAHHVSAEEFANLLFCRLAVHSRMAYEESVEEIWRGRLGGRSGWGMEMPNAIH